MANKRRPKQRAGLAMRPVQRKVTKETSKQPRFTAVEPQGFYFSVLQWLQTLTEQEPPYTVNSMERDKWLGEVWRLEPHLAGVLNSVVSIDTNRGWSLEGGRNQVMRYTDILHSWQAAPGIQGWRPGISSASLSYYYSDLGSIVELGRDDELGPLRGLYHVDSSRCILNGSNETPLTYFPSIVGAGSSDAQDWTVADYMRMVSMINTFETMNGLGFCAVSRCIELTKLMVAVYEHDKEELGAKAPRGLLMLSGISEAQWDTAMEARKDKLEGEGYDYFNAVMVLAASGLDQAKAELVALSNLPKGFDLQQFTSMLMYGYALCFGYDPSEFYPVQFGALGRGTEMEVQHEKATGKGGLNFILALQEQMQRPDILPASLQFEFEQRDEQAEIEEAAVHKAWADVFRELRETGLVTDTFGGISRTEYRMLLADHNIIPKEWTEVEEDVESTDEEAPDIGEGKPLLGEEASTGAPSSTAAPVPAPAIPLPIPHARLMERQRKILRDQLLSTRHIWETIHRFPDEDIVRYRWSKEHAYIETIWEQSSTLLDRVIYPAARAKDTKLYKSKDVNIYQYDVDLALEEAELINSELADLLRAEKAEERTRN